MFDYNPYDGFRFVFETGATGGLGQLDPTVKVLRLLVIGNGETIDEIELARLTELNKQHAEISRLAPVMQALCGYINSGGELAQLLDIVLKVCQFGQIHMIELPENWELLSWLYDTSDPGQYLFINNVSGEAIIVTPDTITEETTVEQLQHEF